jgi:hypothetical protein
LDVSTNIHGFLFLLRLRQPVNQNVCRFRKVGPTYKTALRGEHRFAKQIRLAMAKA